MAREADRKKGRGGSREDDHRGYIFPDPDLESESSAFPSSRERKALAIPHDDPWRGGCPLLGWVDCPGRGSGLGRWVPWIYFQPVVRGNSGGEQQYRHVLPFFVDFSQVGSLVQRSWAPQAAAVVGPGSGTRGRYTSMIDSLSHCSREVAAHFFFLFPSSTRKEFPQPQPGRHRR